MKQETMTKREQIALELLKTVYPSITDNLAARCRTTKIDNKAIIKEFDDTFRVLFLIADLFLIKAKQKSTFDKEI